MNKFYYKSRELSKNKLFDLRSGLLEYVVKFTMGNVVTPYGLHYWY